MRNNSLYKFVITSIILILALSVSGWSSCSKVSYLASSVDAGSGSCEHSEGCGTICSFRESAASLCTYSCGVFVSGNNYYVDGYPTRISRYGSGENYYCKNGSMDGSNYCYMGSAPWYVRCTYRTVCTSQAEADSVKCALNPSDPSCCDAHCECDKAGGTWHPNGYCVKDCHAEACCDSLNVPQVAYDSVYIWQNNSCTLHWRCESPQAECVAINGLLVADVLPDTTTQDGTTTITNKCYYNCGRVIPSDSSKSMVDGNIVLPSSAALISQGIKTPNPFDAIRSEADGEYTYDFLSPQAGHYLDSISFTPCVQVLYRCVLNGKYAYYYDNQTAPSGCTNIVKIK